jgi:hypothetical protein
VHAGGGAGEILLQQRQDGADEAVERGACGERAEVRQAALTVLVAGHRRHDLE